MSSASSGRWGALAAMLGGALWALFPFGTPIASLAEPGTPTYFAAAAYYGLMGVVPLLLLLVGLAGLYAGQRWIYGRLGKAGFPVSILALALMFTGNAVEVASLAFRGSESAVGHFTFLIGFLLLLIGSVLVGLAIWRVRRDPPARSGSLLLIGALPLGILLAVVLGSLAPESDLGFWAAIAVPFGVAWVVLGQAFRSRPAEPAVDFFTTARPAVPREAFPTLTEREREMLHLMTQGASNAEIARLLSLSAKTVANYVSNILHKLQVADRKEAVLRAREAGLGREGT